MKNLITIVAFIFAFQMNGQQSFSVPSSDNSVVMTWNKNTPEQEMKDDIKALKTNNGVTIKYSGVKRNSKNEIINLRIEYADNEGNSGSQEYNNKNAIPEIKFYKINGEIGFGDPNNKSFGGNNNLAFQNFDLNDLQNQLSKGMKIDSLGNNKIFSFDFNDSNEPNIVKKSKIIIQKDGRKPLVIEDGKVTEGANDYSKEEIEKIQNEHKFESKTDTENSNLGRIDMNDFLDQMKKMQGQLQKDNSNNGKNQEDSRVTKPSKSEQEDLKKEMRDARDEMIKAKKELEEAKKEVQKAKSEMKIQKT